MEAERQDLDWLPECDFAVLGHGFERHGRDYVILVQDVLGDNPGTHKLVFTHVVQLDYETRVRDDVWPESWGDEFTDYRKWLDEGEPSGYVWGTEWSNAYPGLTIVGDSSLAQDWSRRIRKHMSEVTLETDRFFIRLVFHAVRAQKVSDATDTISQVIVPKPDPSGGAGRDGKQ